MSVLTVLGRVFSSEIDLEEENYESIIMVHPELIKALKDIEDGKLKKEVEKFTNTSNVGGNLKKKYEAPEATIIDEKSQERLEKMTKILKGEKSLEDNELGK